MNSTFRQRLLASSLLIGAATLATPAWAQQDTTPETPVSAQPDPDAGSQDPGAEGQSGIGEEVVITGSRIARRDLTSSSPVAVVQDEEFALSGTANAEQVIANLPQAAASTSAFSNNPGGGVALLDLRNLGFQRNLVLVNGRRYIFFDPNQVVDINTIPTFLLDSVDVVTGGQSAVYGSDALAGVINFRLRTDLDGVLAGGGIGITADGDGRRQNLFAAIGTTFADGRGHLAAYGEWNQRGSIFQSGREFSRFAFSDSGGQLAPGGSAGTPQGRIEGFGPTSVDLGTNYAGLGAFFQTPGTSIPYCGAPCSYNYAPSNYLMVPQKRWTLGGYGEYEVAENVSAYGEVAFINNQVDNELAATPITQRVYMPLTTACGFVSAADCAQLTTIAANQAALIAGGDTTSFAAFDAGAGSFNALQPGEVALNVNTRFVQIANRRSIDDRNAYRILAGVRGEFFEGLNFDLYYMNSRTKNAQIQEGNVSRSNFVTLVENGTCNVFGLNQFSDACIEGIGILAQNQEVSRLQVVQGSVSGSVFRIPWANDPIGFAVGAEYRKMGAQFIPDTALSSGDVAGFNAGDPTKGTYDVKEAFGELRIPIIQGGFIDKFVINLAGRWSEYSLDAVGGVPTYAIGAEIAPVRDLTFRGQYQRAVRAPNVQELFGGQSVGFPAASDPCAATANAGNATIRALCIATGVPANAPMFTGAPGPLQPNQQIEGVFGGNPDLQEEVADTYTIGGIFSPRFIPRLNIALDWYDIKIENAISAAGGGVPGVLNLCYVVFQDANHPTCQAINRDQQGVLSGGGVFVVEALNANLAGFETRGIDLQVDYSLPLEFGLASPQSRMSFYFMGNRTSKANFIPVIGAEDKVECAGRFGLQCNTVMSGVMPKYRWTSRLTWLDGPVTSSIRWRHIGRVKDDNDATTFVVEEIKSHNLWDLAFSFNVTDSMALNMGINNLFDKKPPVLGSNQQQANTYPSTYDVLGRDYFVSTTLRF